MQDRRPPGKLPSRRSCRRFLHAPESSPADPSPRRWSPAGKSCGAEWTRSHFLPGEENAAPAPIDGADLIIDQPPLDRGLADKILRDAVIGAQVASAAT